MTTIKPQGASINLTGGVQRASVKLNDVAVHLRPSDEVAVAKQSLLPRPPSHDCDAGWPSPVRMSQPTVAVSDYLSGELRAALAVGLPSKNFFR